MTAEQALKEMRVNAGTLRSPTPNGIPAGVCRVIAGMMDEAADAIEVALREKDAEIERLRAMLRLQAKSMGDGKKYPVSIFVRAEVDAEIEAMRQERGANP